MAISSSFLVLATDAANTRAREFYHHLGFLEEDVTLVKLLKDVILPLCAS